MALLASRESFILPQQNLSGWEWDSLDKDDDITRMKEVTLVKERPPPQSKKALQDSKPSFRTADNGQNRYNNDHGPAGRGTTHNTLMNDLTSGQKRHSHVPSTTPSKRIKTEHPSQWEDVKPVIRPHDPRQTRDHAVSTRSAPSAGSKATIPFVIDSDSEDEIVVAQPWPSLGRKPEIRKLENGTSAHRAAQRKESEILRQQALSKKNGGVAETGLQQAFTPTVNHITIDDQDVKMNRKEERQRKPADASTGVAELHVRKRKAAQDLRSLQAKLRQEVKTKPNERVNVPPKATTDERCHTNASASTTNRFVTQESGVEAELQARLRKDKAAKDLQQLQAKLRHEANVKAEEPNDVKAGHEALVINHISNGENVADRAARIRRQREKAADDLRILQAKLHAKAEVKASEEARLKERALEREKEDRRAAELRDKVIEARQRQMAQHAQDKARREVEERTRRELEDRTRREVEERTRGEVEEHTRGETEAQDRRMLEDAEGQARREADAIEMEERRMKKVMEQEHARTIAEARRATELRQVEEREREARRAAELRQTEAKEREVHLNREASNRARLKAEADERDTSARRQQAEATRQDAVRKAADARNKDEAHESFVAKSAEAVPRAETRQQAPEHQHATQYPEDEEQRRAKLAEEALVRALALETLTRKPHTNIWRESPAEKQLHIDAAKEAQYSGSHGGERPYEARSMNEAELKKQQRVEAMKNRNSRNRDVIDENHEDYIVEEYRSAAYDHDQVRQAIPQSSLGQAPFSLNSQAGQAAIAHSRTHIPSTGQERQSGNLDFSNCPAYEAPWKKRESGEGSLSDVQLVHWRQQGLFWSEIMTRYEQMTGVKRGENHLRTRWRQVEAALNAGDPMLRRQYHKLAHGVSISPCHSDSETQESRHVDFVTLTSSVPDQEPTCTPERPTTGGKTMNEEAFRHILAMISESNAEDAQIQTEDDADEQNFTEEDFRHFYYVVQRRELSRAELDDRVEIDDKPFLDCGTKEHSSLSGANKAAAQEARRARDDDLADALNDGAYSCERTVEDGLHSHTADYGAAGKVNVRVHRRGRDARDRVRPKSMEGFVSRTIWFVMKRTVSRFRKQIDALDDLFDEPRSCTKDSSALEELLDNGSFTEREMAQRAAFDHAFKLGFQSTSTNLDERDRERREMETALHQQFEEHGEATFELDDVEEGRSTEVKIFVKEGCLRGARNL